MIIIHLHLPPGSSNLVLLCNMGFHGWHKIQDHWLSDPYEVVDHPDESILVYHLHPISGSGPTKTIHHNLLLPLSPPTPTPVLAGEGPGDRDSGHSSSSIASLSHHFTLPSGASLQPLSSAVDETTLVTWPSMQMTGVDGGTETGLDVSAVEEDEEYPKNEFLTFSLSLVFLALL